MCRALCKACGCRPARACGAPPYLHQGRPLLSDWNYSIVDEDEGVNPRVRDGPRRQRFRTSKPIIGRMWAFSSRTTSRSPVSICVVMVFCTFRSSLILVIATCRLAGAAARFVAEGLVLSKPTPAQRCTYPPHAPGGYIDAQVSTQVNRSVGHKLYVGGLLGLLSRSFLKPVVQRAARAATHYLGYLLRRGVLRLDPGPLLHVEDLRQPTHALGEVQAPSPVVVDRCAGSAVRPSVGDSRFFSI